MKQILHISFVLILQFSQTIFAQISPDKLQPFIGELTLINSSGPGLTESSGDILLVLKETNNDDEIILKLVRNQKGTLNLIGENNQLLMGQGLLGNSGGGSAELKENILQIKYGIGSNSSYSKVSILFKKGKDSNYYFEELLSQSAEYGKIESILQKKKLEKYWFLKLKNH